MLLRVIDVLPRALAAAASAVRSADVVPDVTVEACGDARLDAAVAGFCSAWSGAGLAEQADEVAALLVDGAQRYVDVEDLLVPRSLR